MNRAVQKRIPAPIAVRTRAGKHRAMARLALVALSVCLALASAAAELVRATGRFTCRGVAVPEARVTLYDSDGLFNEKLAGGTTDGAGFFELSGEGGDGLFRGGPDVYVKLEYEHQSEARGGLKVVDFGSLSKQLIDLVTPLDAGPSADSTPKKNDHDGKETIAYGAVNFDNAACVNYVHFYAAVNAYFSSTGKVLPYGTLSVTVNVLGSLNTILGNIPGLPERLLKVPFAPYTRVMVPTGYEMSGETAKHEFGHTLRHKFDGDKAHWVYDAGRFVYPRNHKCKDKTNEGFAFNEGFANWNAGTTCGDVNGAMDVEGNVALALKKLQETCTLSYKEMWAVLEDNPGKIHSFADFKGIATLACPTPVITPPPARPTEAVPPSTVPASDKPRPTTPAPVVPPPVSECSAKPTLRLYSGYSDHGEGHLNDAVKDLQGNYLNPKAGAGLDADGFFGPATEAAVRSWQTTNGLEVDGIVGHLTWGSLC